LGIVRVNDKEEAMFSYNVFKEQLDAVKDDPKKLAMLHAQVLSHFNGCLRDIARYIPDLENCSDFSLAVQGHKFAAAEKAADKSREDMMEVWLTSPRPTPEATSEQGPFLASLGFAAIEKQGQRVQYVFLSPRMVAYMRNHHENQYEAECQAVLLKRGFMGTMWGARFVLQKDLPDDILLFAGETMDPNAAREFHSVQFVG